MRRNADVCISMNVLIRLYCLPRFLLLLLLSRCLLLLFICGLFNMNEQSQLLYLLLLSLVQDRWADGRTDKQTGGQSLQTVRRVLFMPSQQNRKLALSKQLCTQICELRNIFSVYFEVGLCVCACVNKLQLWPRNQDISGGQFDN